MESAKEFIFDPLPPIDEPDASAAAAAGEPVTFAASAAPAHPLGPLTGLTGTWKGHGFNIIWRPNQTSASDHFLQLNVTSEQLEFGLPLGKVPNRGLAPQRDISLHGLNYLQRISDKNLSEHEHRDSKQHFEPGLWVLVPKTQHPGERQTVARLASIPHGTTILAQGTAETFDGGPLDSGRTIPKVNITPFTSGLHHPPRPTDLVHFPQEQDLHKRSHFRTSGPGLRDITQGMLDDPNSVLRKAIHGQHILTTTKLDVSTHGSLPGGGAANIAFLRGGGPRQDGPNAVTTLVTATFWLETLEGHARPTQLQYTQTVLLDFASLSWPHVTVATLQKQPTPSPAPSVPS